MCSQCLWVITREKVVCYRHVVIPLFRQFFMYFTWQQAQSKKLEYHKNAWNYWSNKFNLHSLHRENNSVLCLNNLLSKPLYLYLFSMAIFSSLTAHFLLSLEHILTQYIFTKIMKSSLTTSAFSSKIIYI